MTGLRVGPDLVFPLDAVTQSFAFIGVRGSGKSTAAVSMAEEMHAAGLPWVAVDPKGDWHGIRSSADGTAEGLPIPIFGGLHGDLPLEPGSGKLIADLIVTENLTCVLDVSEFDSKAAQVRFLTEFADHLYRLHGRDPQPRHVFVEEAQNIVPQRVMSDMARCVGAWSKLVAMGRQRGLGISLLSQRCATVNKDVLTQTETLVIFRTTSAQDRAAAKAWTDYHSVSKELVDSLPSMRNGEAWVCSPQWLQIVERSMFRRRQTFDTGATPTMGATREVASMRDIDLGDLRARMAATIEHAAANDPAKLKRRVADLERQLAAVADRVEVQTEYVEVPYPFISPATEELITAVGGFADTVMGEAKRLVDLAVLAGASTDGVAVFVPDRQSAGFTAVAPSTLRAVERATQKQAPARKEPSGDVPLKAGARRMLDTIVGNHPVHYSRPQIGALTGIKHTGGTFGTYFGTLKRGGLIEERDGLVWPTDAGMDTAGVVPNSPTSTEDVLAVWRGALKRGARDMLDAVIAASAHEITRGQLAEAVGIEVSGGTFGTYLGTLKRNGLVDVDGDMVRASEALMLP